MHLLVFLLAQVTDSGQFTDTTIVKSGPFAGSYEVRGRQSSYFFPPNTLITTAGNDLLVRAYGEIFVYRLTGARVRKMSSLDWIDAKDFPAERNDAILIAYRKSIGTGTPRGAGMDCPDCDAVVPDPMPPSGPPLPVPRMPPIPLPVPH
jgi:hypothetical protein